MEILAFLTTVAMCVPSSSPSRRFCHGVVAPMLKPWPVGKIHYNRVYRGLGCLGFFQASRQRQWWRSYKYFLLIKKRGLEMKRQWILDKPATIRLSNGVRTHKVRQV